MGGGSSGAWIRGAGSAVLLVQGYWCRVAAGSGAGVVVEVGVEGFAGDEDFAARAEVGQGVGADEPADVVASPTGEGHQFFGVERQTFHLGSFDGGGGPLRVRPRRPDKVRACALEMHTDKE